MPRPSRRWSLFLPPGQNCRTEAAGLIVGQVSKGPYICYGRLETCPTGSFRPFVVLTEMLLALIGRGELADAGRAGHPGAGLPIVAAPALSVDLRQVEQKSLGQRLDERRGQRAQPAELALDFP